MTPAAVSSQVHKRIPMQSLINPGEHSPSITGMSYHSVHDELFLADFLIDEVRSIRLRDNPCDLRHAYSSHESPYNVCHVSDSDTLILCSEKGSKNWLVALSRSGTFNEWREAHR